MEVERPHIITLSGKPGSGKSSTSDKVAELLGYTRYSSGGTVRRLIKKKGMTLAEYNEQAAGDHDIDRVIDEELRSLRNETDLVIDSRLGFYWIPESFKVYLDLDLDVAAARIFSDSNENSLRSESGEQLHSMEEVHKDVRNRMENEQRRFRELYGIDPYDRQHFDLIVDTSRHTPMTVALAVYDNYNKWLKTEKWRQVVSKIPLGYSFKDRY